MRQPLIPCALAVTLTLASLGAAPHHHGGYANGVFPGYVGGTLAGNQGTAAEIRALRQAYRLLSSANHDYQGHRAEAMRSVRAAAQLLGANVGGGRKTQMQAAQSQQQGNSDARLRTAQSMLQQVRSYVVGGNQQPVVQHVDNAIHHITVALSIK